MTPKKHSGKQHEEKSEPPRPGPARKQEYVVTNQVRLDPAGLSTFDPSRVSLTHLAALLRFVPAMLFALKLARSGELAGITPEKIEDNEDQFRVSIRYAERAAFGLGERLQRTGLVPDAFAIEMRIRQNVYSLKTWDMLNRTAAPPAEIVAVAAELELLAHRFAHIPQAADVPPVEHATDFTWVRVGGEMYYFSRRQQALVVQRLFNAWEASGYTDGAGLREETIREAIDSQAERFRMSKLFEGHPALGTILRSTTKGTWGLYLGGNPSVVHRSGMSRSRKAK